MIITESFPVYRQHLYKESYNDYYLAGSFDKFHKESKNQDKQEFWTLLGTDHANQCDAACLQPLEVYAFEIKKMPSIHFDTYYMINAWLALDFLRKQQVLTNYEPEAYAVIEANIAKNKGMVSDQLKKTD